MNNRTVEYDYVNDDNVQALVDIHNILWLNQTNKDADEVTIQFVDFPSAYVHQLSPVYSLVEMDRVKEILAGTHSIITYCEPDSVGSNKIAFHDRHLGSNMVERMQVFNDGELAMTQFTISCNETIDSSNSKLIIIKMIKVDQLTWVRENCYDIVIG